mgnify:CR=1 FL=1
MGARTCLRAVLMDGTELPAISQSRCSTLRDRGLSSKLVFRLPSRGNGSTNLLDEVFSIRHRVHGLDFAIQVLAPGGTYLAKVLRGGTEGEMLKQMKRDFSSVRHVKPMASRDDSAELFVLAMGFRGA